jgi:hypothetical protein
MGSALFGLNHAVSPVSDGSGRSPSGRVRVVAQAALAAVAFSFVSSALLQGLATWRAWESAAPVRVSVAALQALTQTRWSVEPSAAGVDTTGKLANADAVDPVVRAKTVRRTAPSSERGREIFSKSRTAANVPLSPERLLLQLALQNSDRVLRLWTSDPISLPARVPVKARVDVAARPKASSPAEIITDRLSIQSAKVMSSHHLASESSTSTSESLKSAPVADQRSSVPAVLSRASEQALVGAPTPVKPQAPISAVSSASENSRIPQASIKRLTKSSSGNAWIVLEPEGQPAIVFAQANAVAVREFPATVLDNQSEKSTQSKSAGVSIQSSAGMVSGWIPAGTEVKVRGAARVDYYSDDGRMSATDSHGERYFVARNVGAGAAVVQMTQEQDGEVLTAAGVPVLPSSATQIDLRQVARARVRGHLWSSESSAPTGVAHAEIRVVGFPHLLAITNKDGSFDLGEIQLPQGLSAFIEARLPGGYTHRYALHSAQASQPVDLFLFSDERVQGWLGSLEGGVSPSSGLIVASVRSNLAQGARPVVKPLIPASEQPAETYWITKDDSLQEPLRSPSKSGAFTQWIGVEVTSRSVLAGLQSARGRWMQAEWVPTSPGVISVLSPSE